MKRIIAIFAAGLLSIGFATAQNIQDEVNAHLTNLPFASFAIKVPTFPDRTFSIKDAGAVGDGVVKNTDAINSTIKKCSEAGGGTVIIPAGLWLTAAITMQSNVNLHLEAGATVVFSGDIEDYPLIGDDFSRLQPLINGSGLKNVAITGKGVFNGNGDLWRPVKKEKLNEKQWKALTKTGEVSADGKMWYPRKGTLAAIDLKQKTSSSDLKTREANEKIKLTMRPYLLNVEKTESMLVEGITLQNSPHITNMLRGIDGLVMRNVSVLNNWWAQNADGLDISASRNVLLYDCTVNTGDDGICMKSSGTPEKGKFKLENIVIKNCRVFHAHGGFVIGSNTDGGMNNIYVSNCTFSWTETGLRFKSDTGRGGKVQNIFIENIYMKDIENEAILFDLSYQDKGAITTTDFKEAQSKVPDFDGISIKNVYSEGSKTAVSIGGNENFHVKNVVFQNMVIQAREGVKAVLSEGITFDNVQIVTKQKPAFDLTKVNGFTLKNIKNVPTGLFVKVKGEVSRGIKIENSDIKTEQVELLDNVPASIVSVK